MKRKPIEKDQKIIPDEILANAHLAAGLDPKKPKVRCEVCAGEVTPNAVEPLCWVCRRLKISAWRDSDLQAAAPE